MATTILWPSTLPKYVEQSGYSEGGIDNLIKTEMNNGPYKTRQKSTRAYQPIKGAMVIDTNQRAYFYTFYKTTIAFGALSFLFPKPENVLENIEAKLTDFGIVPISGSQWRLSLSLLVLV